MNLPTRLALGAALCGAVLAFLQPVAADTYVTKTRAVITDTNDVVTSHSNITVQAITLGGESRTNWPSAENYSAVSNAALSAVQPGDAVSSLTNDAAYLTAAGSIAYATNAEYALTATNWTGSSALGTAAYSNASAFATAAQGSKADTALQPGASNTNLVNTAGYLTSEADTLASVTARGATTTSNLVVGGITSTGAVVADHATVTNRLTAAGITSSGANTNTASTVWRSSGAVTTASVDNETGAVVVRGEDSDLRYGQWLGTYVAGSSAVSSNSQTSVGTIYGPGNALTGTIFRVAVFYKTNDVFTANVNTLTNFTAQIYRSYIPGVGNTAYSGRLPPAARVDQYLTDTYCLQATVTATVSRAVAAFDTAPDFPAIWGVQLRNDGSGPVTNVSVSSQIFFPADKRR